MAINRSETTRAMPERPSSVAPQDTPRDRPVAVQAALGLTPPDLAAALHISTLRLHQLMSSCEGAWPLLPAIDSPTNTAAPCLGRADPPPQRAGASVLRAASGCLLHR